MKPAFYMAETDAAVPIGAVVAGDAPKQTFLKETVRVGKWVMSDGAEVEVTPARMSGWVDSFNALKDAGIAVKLMSGHSFEPGDSRGDIDDLFIAPSPRTGEPSLFSKFTAIGQDAIDEVRRNDVSIFAGPFKDGTGKEWADAPQHVALTPIPVVTGLAPAVPIAASRGGTNRVPVARLSRQEKPMPFDWKPLAAALSLDPATLTDDTAGAALSAKIGELTKLPAQVESLTTQVATLSRKPECDPDALDMMAKAQLSRIGALSTAGKVNAAQKTELEALVCGTEAARPAAMLSRKVSIASGLGDKPLCDRILDIFEKGSEPKARGSATGVQLSREGADEAANTARIVAEQAARAGVKAK